MIDFIDVAYHDGIIDWTKVKPKFKGAIAKAGDGYYLPVDWNSNGYWNYYINNPAKRWHQDVYFERNWKALEGEEIRGAYWFLRLNFEKRPWDTDATIERQARMFADIVLKAGLRDTDYIVADVEEPSAYISYLTKTQKAQRVLQFLTLVEQHLGKRPIIYTFPSWWPENIGVAGWELGYKLWIADPELPLNPLPKPWTSYWAWQNSWSGVVDGINASVDMNVIGADYVAANPTPPAEPPLTLEDRVARLEEYVMEHGGF